MRPVRRRSALLLAARGWAIARRRKCELGLAQEAQLQKMLQRVLGRAASLVFSWVLGRHLGRRKCVLGVYASEILLLTGKTYAIGGKNAITNGRRFSARKNDVLDVSGCERVRQGLKPPLRICVTARVNSCPVTNRFGLRAPDREPETIAGRMPALRNSWHQLLFAGCPSQLRTSRRYPIRCCNYVFSRRGNLFGSFAKPGKTVFKSFAPRWPWIISPRTERKSVVSARSRPSFNCCGPRPGHLP
jgi:hypothetical protein